jgi:hypothetical protein
MRLRDERGAAVVDFVLMSVLLVMLLFAVLQVAVYFYARNVVAASAADAARYAAAEGVDPRVHAPSSSSGAASISSTPAPCTAPAVPVATPCPAWRPAPCTAPAASEPCSCRWPCRSRSTCGPPS